MPTQSWSGKSAVFLMESALTSHASSKSNKRQRNLGLELEVIEDNKKSSFDTFQVIMHQVLKVIIFQLTILPYMVYDKSVFYIMIFFCYMLFFRRSRIRSLLTYFCYGCCCLVILKMKIFSNFLIGE